MNNKPFIHPYIPNSVPEIKKKMLAEIGVKDIEELYEDIPPELRLKRDLNLPEPLLSELELRRHMEAVLDQNLSCGERSSFLGGGCARHYVPAICDEIAHRSEFLTAYAGEPYEDAGRFQALFEYESLMAELLDFDVVNVPTYDWGQAASTAARMAGRITGRGKLLVSDTMSPDRLAVVRNYCHPVMSLEPVGHHKDTGLLDLGDLKAKLTKDTAAVYFENPSYLGFIETQGEEISSAAHANGSLVIAGVDPISLGVLKPPGRYGADLACGDIQGLGNHMFYGGSLGGFIATRDEEKFVMEYPSRLFGIARTSVEGEWGFGDVAYSRTSFDKWEKGKEFIGTAAALYGVAAAVYLALMGPQGMRELGIHILQKARYAAVKLTEIPGTTAPFAAGKRRIEQVRYSWEELTKETGVDTHQFALRMADFGFHLWSSHHPFLVPQPFTIEPTESYSKEELDEYVDGLRHVAEEARREPETVKNAPHRSVVHKIDESTFDDPAKWAITWRAYRKKHGNPAAKGGTK